MNKRLIDLKMANTSYLASNESIDSLMCISLFFDPFVPFSLKTPIPGVTAPKLIVRAVELSDATICRIIYC
ncbi:MAG: hypothetical protein IJT30_02005 [Muribaculaceae bacterium]|nr:hypothetical protein [Muribaculaceae bacterium]